MTGIPPSSAQIEQLVAFFLPQCKDKTTLRTLRDMASDPEKWRNAYTLFGRIRHKTLRADDNDDSRLQWQYSFEEICAKTLYNMTGVSEPVLEGFPAPFDEDSAEYVGPIALGFAEYLKLEVPDFIQSLISNIPEAEDAR
jgi:hypothetical protein